MAYKPVMSILAAKAALNAATALVTTQASMIINSGSQPATTLTADSGTNLANPVPNATAFGAATSGTSDGLATSAAGTIASDTNANGGVAAAGYFRFKSTAGVTIFQGNVGTTGCDLNLNTTTITGGDTVAVTSFKITLQCGDGVT